MVPAIPEVIVIVVVEEATVVVAMVVIAFVLVIPAVHVGTGIGYFDEQ
jgi:hypothetical protein